MHHGHGSDKESKNELENEIVRFHPEAVNEFVEAARFYESRCTCLGDRFINRVEDAVHFIQVNPLLFRVDSMKGYML